MFQHRSLKKISNSYQTILDCLSITSIMMNVELERLRNECSTTLNVCFKDQIRFLIIKRDFFLQISSQCTARVLSECCIRF